MKNKLLLSTVLLLISILSNAANIKTYVKDNCGSCHALKEVNKSVTERLKRKGSHLYYAGNKYKQLWLKNYLINPSIIRPSGAFPPNHTIVTDDGDIIDEKSLPKHIKLSAIKAEEVSQYLMTLKNKTILIDNISYQPKKISKSSGKLNFIKFSGCQSCHRNNINEGGTSGPELYTAYNRLQEKYIFSYTKNPELWDINTMMPNTHLSNKKLQKIVDYLKIIGEKNAK